MAKKRRKNKTVCDLPPEGMWISPAGRWFPITEHLLAIQERPDIFGISQDVRHADIPELRELAVELIESGWTRFRYLDGNWLFEVDFARTKMSYIDEVLSDCGAHSSETVTISQVSGKSQDFEGTVDDVFDRKILSFQNNPKKNKWRLS